ncbi:MAG TPA: hypothetical protein VKM54_06715, partial [Myxococcota bacterium]|nr:hypothetical protein [Myxococcota bacterium]
GTKSPFPDGRSDPLGGAVTLLARLAPSACVVRPATVIRWHRQGFRLYWRWKSRSRSPGRPTIEAEIRDLELLKLGFTVAQSTVSKYLPRNRRPPSQTWRTFFQNHLREAIAIDFAVVPTATFRLLYVFVVLSLERRRLLHVHVTTHPTAAWTARQMVEVIPRRRTLGT